MDRPWQEKPLTGSALPLRPILGNHRPRGRTEETTMHPVIRYCLIQARTADLRQQAQRDRFARAARRSRRSQREHPAAGRLRTALRAFGTGRRALPGRQVPLARVRRA